MHRSNINILYKVFATVFLWYLRGTWRYLNFFKISAVNFYYVINKLLVLVHGLR
jgi:hypothetical protein